MLGNFTLSFSVVHFNTALFKVDQTAKTMSLRYNICSFWVVLLKTSIDQEEGKNEEEEGHRLNGTKNSPDKMFLMIPTSVSLLFWNPAVAIGSLDSVFTVKHTHVSHYLQEN